ncbi:hypothetical protein FRC02_004343 [Tulasnella sp. 418]|nr:hypothetical protein FRC02_004343 [Tulasnella sp. 418]
MDPQHPWTPGGWPPGDTYYQYLPSNGAQVPPTTSTYIHHPSPSYPTATYSAPNAYPDYGHSHQISSHNPPVYRHPISTSYHSFQPQLPSNFVPRGVPQIITADHHMPSSHTSSVGYVHAPQPRVQPSTPSHTTSQPTWDSSHVGPSNSVPMYDPNPVRTQDSSKSVLT